MGRLINPSNLILAVLLAVCVWAYNGYAESAKNRLQTRHENAKFVVWCQQHRQLLSEETAMKLDELEGRLANNDEVTQ